MLFLLRRSLPHATVSEALSVSDPTARASIRALERAGILHEADPNRKWGKIFIADQILSLIRGDE